MCYSLEHDLYFRHKLGQFGLPTCAAHCTLDQYFNFTVITVVYFYPHFQAIPREREIPLPQTPKQKRGLTPKKLKSSAKKTPIHLQSPGGPTAVRSTEFKHIATLPIHIRMIDRTHFNLDRVWLNLYILLGASFWKKIFISKENEH